jgi:hypothetical protein
MGRPDRSILIPAVRGMRGSGFQSHDDDTSLFPFPSCICVSRAMNLCSWTALVKSAGIF